MKQMINGTSALADMVCWNIWKTRSDDRFTEYALHAGSTGDGASFAVLVRVIAALMAACRVAVRVEGTPSSASALASLEEIWPDGRMLKRADSAAFVALTDRLDGDEMQDGLEVCVGADVAFCFMGFDEKVDADHAFRCLLGDETYGAPQIELTCAGMEMGDLYIRLDVEQVDECALLSAVRDAVAGCGRYLQMEM